MAETLKGKKIALVSVDWDEISGVDHPANQSEGWLVVKSANGAPSDNSSSDDADDSEIVAQILSNYLDGAPSEISDAAQKVVDYIATVETDAAQDTADGANTENETPTTKGKVRKFINRLLKAGGSAVVITEAQQTEFLQSLRPDMTAQEKHEAVAAFKRSVVGDKN